MAFSKTKLVREYLNKFGDMPNLTLARKLHKDCPEVFPTIENARTLVRYTVGSFGQENRKRMQNKEYMKEENLKKYFEFAEGEHFDMTPYKIRNKKIVILNDIHFPYNDKHAILTALDFAAKKEVDGIIINGDLMDCQPISRFIKDPRARDMKYELDVTKQFLTELRSFFPGIDIYYKEGNHEYRWKIFLMSNAPMMLNINEFRLDVLLELRAKAIQWIDNKKLIQFGKLNILHGHEYKGGGGGVNPARWLSLRTNANAVCGHFHRISQHFERDVTGKQMGWWSMGCLSDLSPEYMPYNNWGHGFGYAEIKDSKGGFRFANKEIIDYKII